MAKPQRHTQYTAQKSQLPSVSVCFTPFSREDVFEDSGGIYRILMAQIYNMCLRNNLWKLLNYVVLCIKTLLCMWIYKCIFYNKCEFWNTGLRTYTLRWVCYGFICSSWMYVIVCVFCMCMLVQWVHTACVFFFYLVAWQSMWPRTSACHMMCNSVRKEVLRNHLGQVTAVTQSTFRTTMVTCSDYLLEQT